MNSTTPSKHPQYKSEQSPSGTLIHHMPWREFDVTINASHFQRYCGMGTTLDDVIRDLNEAWIDAVKTASDSLDEGTLDGTIEDFARDWSNFTIWQRDTIVAVVIPPEDPSLDLVVIKPSEVAKLRLGHDVKMDLDRLAETTADLIGQSQWVAESIVKAQEAFWPAEAVEIAKASHPAPDRTSMPPTPVPRRHNDRPFRINEGESVVRAYFDASLSSDDVIKNEIDDYSELLKGCPNPEIAQDLVRSTPDRSIWQVDEHGTDRLLAVIRALPNGTPDVLRLDGRGANP